MSYPYTKPQPRYGFRRDWNNPNTGLVGSGPGRPLRRYVTDAEVGLPQKGAGLGASQETPITQGIFNVGPSRGFSRGVFTPDPPWATPRYIADMRDGVNGLGGCLACGGLGQDADPCGLDKVKNIIVSKITGELPTFKVDLKITSFTVDRAMVASALKGVLDSLQPTALNAVSSAANSSISAVRTALTTYVTPLIVSAAKAALPSQYSSYAYVLSSLIDNAMKPLYDKIATEIQKCKGITPAEEAAQLAKQATFDPNLIGPSAAYCTDNGYQAIPLQPGEFGYDASTPKYKCGLQSASQQMDVLSQVLSLTQNATMQTTDLSKAAKIDASMLTTVAAEQAKCASAGGAWYPGGAECDVASNGSLYNCRAPTSLTTKRYNCVPAGTSGAVAASGSSMMTPLLLGGAAIVALLLFAR